jgi:hypothetical protein
VPLQVQSEMGQSGKMQTVHHLYKYAIHMLYTITHRYLNEIYINE